MLWILQGHSVHVLLAYIPCINLLFPGQRARGGSQSDEGNWQSRTLGNDCLKCRFLFPATCCLLTCVTLWQIDRYLYWLVGTIYLWLEVCCDWTYKKERCHDVGYRAINHVAKPFLTYVAQSFNWVTIDFVCQWQPFEKMWMIWWITCIYLSVDSY